MTTDTAIPAIPKTMRSAVLFGLGDFRIVEKSVPVPGPGEVLVRVAMCGTCGTDIRIQTQPLPGQPPFGQFTPGHEWTGTVVALGESVNELAVGDRVVLHAHRGCMRCENCLRGYYTACLNYGHLEKGHRATGMTTDGGFAEYVVHHVSSLYRLPDNVSWEDAVLIVTAGTGLYGLDTIGGYIAGDTVAIIGAGPIGLMALQACKALGAERVILIDVLPSRLEIGSRLGADIVVDARTQHPVSASLEAAGRRGVDLVIEASGSLGAPQQCLEIVRPAGKILFLAFYKERVSLDLSLAVRDHVTLYSSRSEGGGNVRRALSLAAQGKIRGRDLVSHHFPLENIQEGFRVLAESRGNPLKIVFVP